LGQTDLGKSREAWDLVSLKALTKGCQDRRNRLKGAPGRGTLEKERPLVFGMIQRGGEVAIQMLANVKQKTIRPLIQSTILPGTTAYTDEMGWTVSSSCCKM
jgi:transposase-like protein